MFTDFSFGSNNQSQFFGDPFGGRSSIPSASQDAQDAAQRKPRKSVSTKQMEPGYFPVTIAMIHQAVQNGSIKPGHCYIHGRPCGVVKLVGYILETQDRGGVTEFEMTDGTAAIKVTAEATSDNDEWFVSKLEAIKPGQLIRVVGTVHSSVSASDTTIRAVHFCSPDPREYAYQHCIETAYVHLSLTQGGNDSREVTSKIADLSLGRKSSVAEDVQLPSLFEDVTQPCHRSVLRYILDARSEDLGVKTSAICLAFQGRYKEAEVNEAVAALLNEGHAFKTLDDYVDALAV